MEEGGRGPENVDYRSLSERKRERLDYETMSMGGPRCGPVTDVASLYVGGTRPRDLMGSADLG